MEQSEYDYIIVGGGTAGAIVAARLAEDPSVEVCLVEGGPSDEGNELFSDIRNWIKLYANPDSNYSYNYSVEPQVRGNRSLHISRARILGGCSSHNQANAFMPPDTDLERWDDSGAVGWGARGMRIAESRVRDKIHIEPSGRLNSMLHSLLEAGQEAGLPLVDMVTAPTEGIGIIYKNKRGYLRQSSSICYLHPMAGLSENLTILSEVWVSRILVEGTKALGVVSSVGELSARREVIICAGAIDSPRLLLLSGIGPEEHLRTLGIDVKKNLLGVGENLMDHVDGLTIYEVNTLEMYPEEDRDLSDIVFYAKSDPDLDDSDIRGVFGVCNFDYFPPLRGTGTIDEAVVMDTTILRPRSRGTVRLRSDNYEEPPLIDFKYFQDKESYDERILVAGTKICRQIMEQPAMARHVRQELFPGADIIEDAAISEAMRANSMSLQHPAGTCKMGKPNDETAVVTPDLKVRGFQNLRIADASVFPTMLSVSPNITVMMIGEKCAELVRAKSQ